MPFLHDDEFVILQVLNPLTAEYIKNIYMYSLDDRKRFRDVGIQSALEYISWGAVCPTPTEYNWHEVESRVNINREA